MSDYPDAQRILAKAGWSSSFQALGNLTYLLLQKNGCEPQRLLIHDVSYSTYRLPAWFFLNAFAEAGITLFDGYEPETYQLPRWDFYHVGGHYEKEHPEVPSSRAVLRLFASLGQPYLSLKEGASETTLLSGPPQSIYHFIHVLEANGLFPPDEPIGRTL